MTTTEIQQLEEWLKNAPKPDMPVFLNTAVEVTDYDLFMESHFSPRRTKPDAKINAPILLRLQQMKLIIESNL